MPEIAKIQELPEKASFYDRMHLRMISLMHDTVYGLYVNPQSMLETAGLKPGQTVLEVGCGPGFFTVAAAEIVGPSGFLYSIDFNPAAVEKVRQKVEAKGLKNVNASCVNASKTFLPEASIDLAFLFGVLHSLRNIDAILLEMHRILKDKGELVVQKSGWSESHLLKRFTKDGLFRFVGKESRIYRFQKES